MNGFIYRRAGVILSAVLVFNSFGMFASASEAESDSIALLEEVEITDDSFYADSDEEIIDIADESERESEDYPEDTYPDEENVYPEESEEDIIYDDSEDISYDSDFDYDAAEPADSDNGNSSTYNDKKSADRYSDSAAEEYFTVSYVSEEYGITDLPVDNNSYKKGDTVMITYLEPIREGYSFWGWSFTGDSSCVYSGGFTFEITKDVTLYATWSSDEFFYDTQRNLEINDFAVTNPIVSSINSYVNSLKGRFNPTFKYKGKVKSIQCCAFTDQIWENALGIGRYSTPGNYKVIDSTKKLGKKQIYEFLKANNAQPGDIIWCHDPVSARKYNITHYMILMGYDKNGITITDGYERNGKGIVWKNNQRVSYTGDHAKYFSGKCYIRLYHVTKTNK